MVKRLRVMEKKLTNSGPLREPADKHSIYAIKQQIVDMAMNASGIRDTARVLHVSPTTVIKELKKKSQSCSR